MNHWVKDADSQTQGEPRTARRWFIGDLQHHEDGSRPMTEHVAIVKRAGYDFVCLQYKDMEDPKKIPDPKALSDDSFLVIPGSEQAFKGSRGLWNHFGFMPFAVPMPDTITDLMNITEGLAEAERRHPGCLKIIHHPDDERWTFEDVRTAYVGGARFIELNQERTGGESAIALWDQALSVGMDFRATISTDAHGLVGIRRRGFVRVRAARLAREDILEALERGDFLAVHEGCKATVSDLIRPEGKAGERYVIEGENIAEVRFIGCGGRRLETVRSDTASYTIVGNEGYVRAEIVDASGLRCFAQPVMVQEQRQAAGVRR